MNRTRTAREVLRIAAALRLDWHIDERGHIRDRKHNLCPITAVCEGITGRRHLPKYWQFAAEDIGLSHDEGAKLTDACDRAHDYDHELRETIKKILIHRTM